MILFPNDICKFGTQIVKKWHYQILIQRQQRFGKN
jgi:hypothetical protein